MSSNAISVAPQEFFGDARSALLKGSVSVFFKIHLKASFTTKHIYALVAVHTFTEKKFNTMNFKA